MSAASGSAPASAPAAPAGGDGSKKSAIPKLPADAPRKREAFEAFKAATRTILETWDLFKTAVVEEWGGRKSRDKFDTIVDDLVMNCEEQWRAGNDVHVDSLDVYLLECLTDDFNIDFEDDSEVTEVSKLIQEVYRKAALGDTAAIAEVLGSLDKHPAMRPCEHDGSDDDEDDEDGSDEDDDEGGGGGGGGGDGSATGGAGTGGGRAGSRVVDEDGWETVVAPPRGKKDKKKGPAAAATGDAPAAAAAAAPAAAVAGDAKPAADAAAAPAPAAATAAAAADDAAAGVAAVKLDA